MKKLGVVCDVLTVSRVVVGLTLIVLGVWLKTEGLRLVLLLLILGWTTDILDGRLARRIGKAENFIGRNEIKFDSFMLVSAVIYLGEAGFINRGLSLLWALVLICLILSPKFAYSLLLVVEASTAIFLLPYILFLASSLKILLVVLGWGLFALVFDWQRAMHLAKKLLRAWEELLRPRFSNRVRRRQ